MTSAKTTDETASFGFRDVALSDKQDLVDDVFHKVAERYDLMNDLMSGGLHRLWKDAMVARLSPPKRGEMPYRVLDVAGGTGDVSFRIVRASQNHARCTVCDINGEMLKVGVTRAAKNGLSDRVDFVQGNAEELPFEDNTFDAYTIAFGIRNVPRIDLALREAKRVLKPGGKFLCLEFSTIDVPALEKVYDFFSFKVIPPMGKMATGDAQPYQYLVESIRQFPSPQKFQQMISAAGFSQTDHRLFTGGVAALHSAYAI